MNVAANCPLPDANRVREMLGLLFDGFAVKPGARIDVGPKSGAHCAIYVTDDGKPAAVCACDLAFAANSGCALSMLPPNAAKDALKTRVLTDVMSANLREIMNICTRLLLVEGSMHLRLESVVPSDKLPAPVAGAIAASKQRVDFELGLGKYGGGGFAAICL